MTKEESDLVIEESERYIGRRYPIINNLRLREYTFVETKENYEDGRYFPGAVLRPILGNSIEIELITVIEYFRRPENH